MRKINNPSEINRKIQNWESISSEEKVSTWIYLDRLNQSNSSYFSNRLYYLKLIYKILLTGDFLSFERFVQRIINLTNQHYFFITNIENEFDAELNFKIQIDPSNDEENIRYLKEIEILINLEDNKNKIIDTIHKERCLSLIGKMYETNGDDELINNMSKALRIPSLIQISINQEEFPQLMDELIKFDFYEVVIPVYQRVCDRWSEEPEIPVAILSEIIKSGRLSQKKEIELYLSYVTSENYVNNMEEICIGNQVKFAEKFKKATEEIWNTIPFCREDTKICLIDFTYASIINNFDRSVECNKYFYENIIPEKIKEYISADLIDTSCRKFGQPLHCLFLNPTYYDPDFRLEKVINAIKSKDGRERAQEDLINTAVSSNFFLSIEQAEELFDLVSGEENMYVRNILFGAGAGFPPQIRLHFFYKLGCGFATANALEASHPWIDTTMALMKDAPLIFYQSSLYFYIRKNFPDNLGKLSETLSDRIEDIELPQDIWDIYKIAVSVPGLSKELSVEYFGEEFFDASEDIDPQAEVEKRNKIVEQKINSIENKIDEIKIEIYQELHNISKKTDLALEKLSKKWF